MKFYNLDLEYYVDYEKRKVHLLDKTQGYSKELANVICPDFQSRFIEHEKLTTALSDFDWLCYNLTGGLIASYRNYSFKLINPKMPYIHEPFSAYIKSLKSKLG